MQVTDKSRSWKTVVQIHLKHFQYFKASGNCKLQSEMSCFLAVPITPQSAQSQCDSQ